MVMYLNFKPSIYRERERERAAGSGIIKAPGIPFVCFSVFGLEVLGSIIGLIKGDTRSVDYGSYCISLPLSCSASYKSVHVLAAL